MKTLKTSKIFFLLAALVFALSSCGKDDNPTSSDGSELVGKWKLTKITLTTVGNLELSPNDIGIAVTFDLKSDRTFAATVTDSSGTSVETGTWSVASGKITMKSSDGTSEELPYSTSGNKLFVDSIIELDNFGEVPGRMEFTKQ